MKSAFHRTISFLLIALFALLPTVSLTGCALTSLVQSSESNIEVIATPESEEPLTGETETATPPELFYHTLTGLACDESLCSSRPISICIENNANSMQYGLSVADVLIEAPVETETRFVAVFTDLDSAKYIGCIASTRSWMMALSNAFGAIAIYNGTTDTPGTISASFPGSDTIDYVQNSSLSLFRKDPSRTFPHNLMTSGDDIRASLLSGHFSLTAAPSYVPFLPVQEGNFLSLSGSSAIRIRAAITPTRTCEFVYNALDRTYTRFQNGTVHTDPLTSSGLSFSNLIFLFCNVDSYQSASGSEYSLDVSSGGQGYLISGGCAIGIRWNSDNGTIQFTDVAGEPLQINCGKTYIAMMKISEKADLQIQ